VYTQRDTGERSNTLNIEGLHCSEYARTKTRLRQATATTCNYTWKQMTYQLNIAITSQTKYRNNRYDSQTKWQWTETRKRDG